MLFQTLVGHSADLSKLVEYGYDIEIGGGNLLVHHIPFVTSEGKVEFGILVSELSTTGESTIQPRDHVMWLVGGIPYDHLGQEVGIVINHDPHDFGNGLIAACQMSGKKNNQVPTNYYDKVENYVRILSGFASVIDPRATYKNAPARESSAEESVFRYHDSATSRSGISAVSAKLSMDKVAIVGLGGTGSYILDLVSKTPVGEIHLYDGDVFYAHNAFRSPGAATIDELRTSPKKVDYLFSRYDPIRREIYAHPENVGADNVVQLRAMSFVFIAIDSGPAKKLIVDELVAAHVPFVDCGIFVFRVENSLGGTLRVTTVTENHDAHIDRRISFGDVNDNEYDFNIQTADLNMMNAAMAVVKWKKFFGYYIDTRHEFNSNYFVNSNRMVSGEMAE